MSNDIVFDPKYGEVQEHTIVADDSSSPYLVAVKVYRGKEHLEIRRLYKRQGGYSFGKGVMIPIEGAVAEEVLLAAQALLLGTDTELT